MAEIEVKDCGDGITVLGFSFDKEDGNKVGFRYFMKKPERLRLIEKLQEIS